MRRFSIVAWVLCILWSVATARADVVRRVGLPGDRLEAALTFDLCPAPSSPHGYDRELVDYLRAESIPATFFMSGEWITTHHDEAAALAMDPLFEVGNHSWSHPRFEKIDDTRRTEELQKTHAAYEALLSGVDESKRPFMRLFRFPYGTCDAASQESVRQAGFTPVLWDVVTGDPSKAQSAHAIERILLTRVRSGSIVVMHANGRGRHTAEALRNAVPELRQQGYAFKTVSALLAEGSAVTTTVCDPPPLPNHVKKKPGAPPASTPETTP